MTNELTDMIREHVMNDLRPYVCTYSDCSQADKTYASRSAFLRHELSIHGRQDCISFLFRPLNDFEKKNMHILQKKAPFGAGWCERSRHVGRHMEEISFRSRDQTLRRTGNSILKHPRLKY